MRTSLRSVWIVASLAACNEGGGAAPGAGDAGGGRLDCRAAAVTLACPEPGPLPFETATLTFADPEHAAIADADPENKSRSADALADPGGALAPLVLQGRMARGAGLRAVPIPLEAVSLWTPSATGEWLRLGETVTDADGGYAVDIGGAMLRGSDGQAACLGCGAPGLLSDGSYPVYGVLEGDGSCVVHGLFLWPPGTPVVVADIDGTLTLSDRELLTQIQDPAYEPQAYAGATELLTTWRSKGYRVVYLTARPHDFRSQTRAWLADRGMPFGPVITAESLVFGEAAVAYKSEAIRGLIEDRGWEIVAAYGNATSDIEAYAAQGVAAEATFVIGEHGGEGATVAIAEDGYLEHIERYVEAQPHAAGAAGEGSICAAAMP